MNHAIASQIDAELHRAWVFLSSIVIIFNKWILDRFPFSITLTTWHMFFSTIATQILARTTTLIQPSPDMNPRLYFTAILPIGFCFSMSLILSNSVYLYLSLSFIQMLKVFCVAAEIGIDITEHVTRPLDQWQPS